MCVYLSLYVYTQAVAFKRTAHLWVNLFSDVGKCSSSVDILSENSLGYIQLDEGLAVDKPVHDVLLQCR